MVLDIGLEALVEPTPPMGIQPSEVETSLNRPVAWARTVRLWAFHAGSGVEVETHVKSAKANLFKELGSFMICIQWPQYIKNRTRAKVKVKVKINQCALNSYVNCEK